MLRSLSGLAARAGAPMRARLSAAAAALPSNLQLAAPEVLEEPPPPAPTRDADWRAPLTADVLALRDGAKVGELELPRDVFGVPFRVDIVQRVVHWQLARRRAGTQHVKRRDEVRGGGKKPWAQKGTGRARAGTIRSPIFRGGGKPHGPRNRDYDYSLPKKVRALGMRVALSQRRREGKLTVVEDGALGSHKTRAMADAMAAHGWETVLYVDGESVNKQLAMAAGNLKEVRVLPARGANVYDIVRRKHLVLTQSAVRELTSRLTPRAN